MAATRENAFPLPPRKPGTRTPDFLLIGAMKAGTTTLSEWLRHHPDLFLSRPKEPQFFSRAEAARRGWDWYGGLFAPARPDQLVGEASTCYSRWPHFGDVAGRLAEHVPDARLIFLARHPVERAYSHYRHEMQRVLARGEAPSSFEDALDALPEIVDASCYPTQLDRFLAHYPEDRLLVLLTDDLHRGPDDVWSRVQAFLGVAAHERPSVAANERANAFGDHLAKRAAEERLEAGYDSWPRRIARRVVPQSLRLRMRRALIAPRVSPAGSVWL